MKRLTTDNPQLNMQTALNLFYVKDGQAFLRGYGDPTGETDISILDMMRQIMQKNDLITGPFTDEEVSEIAEAWLTDGQLHDIETISALLYTAGWAFAEIRARLKAIEDIFGEEYDLAAIEDMFRELCDIRLMMGYRTHKELEERIGDFDRLRELVAADRAAVKVGSKVYRTDGIRIYESTVENIVFTTENIAFDGRAMGKTIFLTREDAEKALARLNGRPAL